MRDAKNDDTSAAIVGKSSVSRWHDLGETRNKSNLAQASADTQTLTLQEKSDWAGTTRHHARRGRGLLICRVPGFEPWPPATSASESTCGLTVQISPSAVAVASYSLVVTPSDAVTGAPPGQVWPPPLTVTSWAPQEYVVVTMCGAIELAMA